MEGSKLYPIDPEFGSKVLEIFSTERPFIYPSVHFQHHPGKPSLTVIKEDAAHCYHRLDLMIRDQRWDDLIVTSFMAAVIHESPDQFSQVLPRQWSSFQLIIGEANATVTPLSIYELRAAKDMPAIEDPINGGDAALRLSTFYALLLLYKNSISKSFKKHGGTSTQSLINYFRSTNVKVQEAHLTRVSAYVEYNMSSGYKKIICAIDMFFNKFPNADYATMRVATLPSRYKGCAAITYLEEVASAGKLASTDLLQFILKNPIMQDVKRVFKKGEEVENPFGYFPYHLEMEFTHKSAYSMSTNPIFCFWLNVIGSVMGIPRHLNAKILMLSPVMQEGTFEVAAAVGLHLRESAGIPEQILATEAVASNLMENIWRAREQKIPGLGATPAVYPPLQSHLLDARVNEVLTSIRTNDGLSWKQKDILRTLALKCHSYPKGTVGAYFYQNYARK